MLSDLTPLRLGYLALALAGAVLGWQAGIPAAPAGSEPAGLMALATWCGVETMVRRNWAAFLTFPAMLLGLGCALPLYLFIRSRRVAG